MDAAALLHRHGWRGKGHSLDANNRGIKKPLLVSSKRDLSGVGQKSKAVRTSDQWWARALDEGLKAVGTGRATTLSNVREKGVNQGGLYGFFVRGEGLEGTITSASQSDTEKDTSTPPSSVEEEKSSADSSHSGSDSQSDSSSEDSDSESEEPVMADSTSHKRKRSATEQPGDDKKRRKGEKGAVKPKPDEAALDRVAEIDAMVLAALRQKEAAGEFGAAVPKIKKKMVKGDEAVTTSFGVHPDRMKMLHREDRVPIDPTKPANMSLKSAKIARHKAIREAGRELKDGLLKEAQDNGELPGMENMAVRAIFRTYKQEKKERKKAKATAAKEAKAARVAAHKQANLERSAAAKAKKQKGAGRADENEAADDGAVGETKLRRKEKLTPDEKRERKLVAQAGNEGITVEELRVIVEEKRRIKDEQTPAERAEAKLAKQAAKKGITLEEHRANIEEKKHIKAEQRAEKIKERHTPKAKRLTDELRTQNTHDLHVRATPLTNEQRAEYEPRAKEKGMTVEAYHARRLEKKAEKKNGARLAPQATQKLTKSLISGKVVK